MPNLIERLMVELRRRYNVAVDRVRYWKRSKPKRPTPNLSWLSSSFAAMEVSGQLKQVFKFFDSNGDGKISPLELSEALRSLGHEESSAAMEAEGIVREMDCNGDGFIDLDEFMTVMDGGKKKRVVGGEGDDEDDGLFGAFLMFDADKNGFISAEELRRVLKRLLGSGNCSLSKCRKMIAGVDKDGDGLVDFEEFKSMMTAGRVTS